MKKRRGIRFIVTLVMLVTLIVGGIVPAQAASKYEIQLRIKGVNVDIPKEYGTPYLDSQGRTMVPIRFISEKLGHKVDWDAETKKVTIDDSVYFTIGQPNISIINKSSKYLDTTSVIKDGRTYVPIRFVAEALDYYVEYEGPKAANGHRHVINIKDGMLTSETRPIKNGNVYTIVAESTTVDFDPTKDTYDWYGEIRLKDEKAYEIMKAFHDSIVYDEYSDYVTLKFFQPYLPDNMSFVTVIELVSKAGEYSAIYVSTSGNTNRYQVSRDNERVEVKFSTVGEYFTVEDIEQVLVLSKIKYNGENTASYREELKTGRVAKLNEFLFTEEEIEHVEDFYLPKYKK